MLIRHYYQTVIREDLLLKYGYLDVMSIPELTQLTVEASKPSSQTDLRISSPAMQRASGVPKGLKGPKDASHFVAPGTNLPKMGQARLALEVFCGQATTEQGSVCCRGKNAYNLLAKLPPVIAALCAVMGL